MKKKELLDRLNLVKGSLSVKDMIPILKTFCVDKKTMYAFNSYQCSGVNIDTKLSCGIPGALFLKIVNSFKSEEISIDLDELTLEVGSGGSNVKLSVFSGKDFIYESPKLPKKHSFEIDGDFIEGLKKCFISVDKRVEIENRNGVILIVNKKTKFLFSLNGPMLSRYDFGADFKCAFKGQLLIPFLFCKELVLYYEFFGPGEMYIGENFMYAKWKEGFLYTGIKIGLMFDDCEGVLNRFYTPVELEFQPVPNDFIGSLDRSLILLEHELSNEIILSMKGKNFNCKTKTKNGEIQDSLFFEKEFGEYTMLFNPDLLKEFINNVEEVCFIEKDRKSIIIGRSENYIGVAVGFFEGSK